MNRDGGAAEVESVVAHDHPALAGHFPGEPLVPGVVVLDCVVAAAEALLGAARPVAIPSVKFLAPLRPDERFRIVFTRLDAAGIAFECRRETTTLVRGRMICRRVDVSPISASGPDPAHTFRGRSACRRPCE